MGRFIAWIHYIPVHRHTDFTAGMRHIHYRMHGAIVPAGKAGCSSTAGTSYAQQKDEGRDKPGIDSPGVES